MEGVVGDEDAVVAGSRTGFSPDSWMGWGYLRLPSKIPAFFLDEMPGQARHDEAWPGMMVENK